MKLISKQIHAYLDYPVAIALMTLPFIFGLGTSHSLAFTLSVVTGIAALVLTLLTNHHLGVLRVFPYKIHLLVDVLVGVTFIVAPFAFSFEGIDAYYYWTIGASVVAVVSLHKPENNF